MNPKWRDTLRDEIKNGGSESPCPLCGFGRVQRSDYLRCVRCGLNWMNGEALDRDPRRQRLERFLAETKATAPKKKESNHA